MKSYQYSVFVRCSGIYDYFVKTGSGLNLYVDPLYKQGAHKVTSGTVVAIPESMPDWSLIVPELQVGDKVYFHYNSLDEDSLLPSTDGVFSILYDMIFCYVRDGKIHPIAGKVLCQPYVDKDIQEVEVGGQMVKVKMTPSGIIKQISWKDDLHLEGSLARSFTKAVITHIGTPLKGEQLPDCVVGETVYYAIHADFENVIEGKTYFVMDQELLLMIDEDEPIITIE